MKHRHTLLRTEKGPLVFGHRGYSAIAPENTMAAFELCRDHQVPAIELDVHLTRDEGLIITHDSDINRVSGRQGIVESMSVAELKSIDVGSFKAPGYHTERMPTLYELFEHFGHSFVYDIELKQKTIRDRRLAMRVWECIRSFGLEESVLVSSFNPFPLRHFRGLCANSIPTAVIYCVDEEVPRLFWHGFGRHIARCDMLKPHEVQITDSQFARESSKGYQMVTWTVDERDRIEELARLGVGGIISNDPGATLRILQELGRD